MMHYPKYQVTNEQSPLKGLRHAQPVSISLISAICVLLLSALNNQSINLNFYGRLHITQRNPASFAYKPPHQTNFHQSAHG